jgi:uncharacterized protein DUF3105
MASRKDEKEQRKQERLRREQDAKASERRRRVIGFGVAGGLVAAVIVAIVIVVASGGGNGASTKDLKAKAAAAGCTFNSYPNFGRNHTLKPVQYKTNPPTSGDHFPVPASDNAYVKAPKYESLVHAEEHGRVIYWYQPKAPQNAKDALNELYRQNTQRVILVPNDRNMPSVVAVSAWQHSITCPKFTDKAKILAAFKAFRDSYRDKAPEYKPFPE